MIQYERPSITDHGSIARHTFFRCESGNDSATKPKDWRDFPTDKFGECSSGHAS
ncbi:MAG TPA: hypothetical protein VKB18_02380 [Gemmatimonadota bacterium]|nr:hypothetical protein [Gemmatimonadota bacterium]